MCSGRGCMRLGLWRGGRVEVDEEGVERLETLGGCGGKKKGERGSTVKQHWREAPRIN